MKRQHVNMGIVLGGGIHRPCRLVDWEAGLLPWDTLSYYECSGKKLK